MPVKQSDIIADALELAEQGWPVFPQSMDKTPLKHSQGFYDATHDPDQIMGLFNDSSARKIGVPTGSGTGILVLDTDPKGMDWDAANQHRLPPTRMHRTPRGGYHRLYQYPAGYSIRISNSKIAPGIDIRGECGYIGFPPSPGYSIVGGGSIEPMPQWLIDECLRVAPQREKPAIPQPIRDPQPRDFGYAGEALEREVENVQYAAEGERHDAQFYAALKLGNFVVSGCLKYEEVESRLLAAAIASGHTEGEARRTISDGIALGLECPRYAPDDGSDQPKGDDGTDLDFTSFADLDKEVFPPLRVIIPGVLYEGLTILGGPPKVGKSFFLMDLMLRCASGQSMWDNETEQCATLLFALQDGKRRLQSRARQLLGVPNTPPGTEERLPRWAGYRLTAPTLDQGLVEKLRRGLQDNVRDNLANGQPKIGIIGIDIFDEIRGKILKGETQYAYDTRSCRDLQALAQEFHVAIVIVVHTVKKTDEDVFKEIGGTYGMTGTADSLMVMTRMHKLDDALPEATCVRFRTQGRDLPTELDLVLQRNEQTAQWECLGEYHLNTPEKRSGTRDEIADVLKNGPMYVKVLAEALPHLSETNLKKTLQRMQERQLVRLENGRWAIY